jgi:adenine-specific DNA-methyltransferase
MEIVANKLPQTTRKDLGAFYTPEWVADYMVSRLSGLKATSKILEPSGGDGAFVSALVSQGFSAENVTVWDLNPDVRERIESLGAQFSQRDTLLRTNTATESGFTHIIGNPPYLNKQSQYIKKNKVQLGKLYREIGANDTYSMFLYLCGTLLVPGGQLCFIISDTFLTLGIHRKLRSWLLRNFVIEEVTLCPSNTFRDTGASVRTCIIKISKTTPSHRHKVLFNDCRKNDNGNLGGRVFHVLQLDILDYPDHVFSFGEDPKLMGLLNSENKLVVYLRGGLGMHTTSNSTYLGILARENSKPTSRVSNLIDPKLVTEDRWRIYHKRGGNLRYYAQPRYCVDWAVGSRGKYKMTETPLECWGEPKFIISGIGSGLCARIGEKYALWESNKAMAFSPKNPKEFPPEFFIGLLNSKVYNRLMRILNHTNSIQIRDIKKLPMLDFSGPEIHEIAGLTMRIIEDIKKGHTQIIPELEARIEGMLQNKIYGQI